MTNTTICLVWCVALATSAVHAESLNTDGTQGTYFDTTALAFDALVFNDVLLNGSLPGLQPTIEEVGIYRDIEAGIANDDF